MTVNSHRPQHAVESGQSSAEELRAADGARPLPAVPAVLYRVDEAAEALRLSRSSIYELIRSGRLRTVKHGSRRLVPVAALDEFVEALAGGAS